MDLSGLHPGGVDHIPALEHLASGGNPPARSRLFQAGDRMLQVQLHPIDHRRLRQGQAVLPGHADGRRGGVQRRRHRLRQVRLHGPGFVAGEQAQAGHPVGHSPMIQRFHHGLLLPAEGQHEGTHRLVGDIQVPAQLPGQLHSPDVQPGHKAAGGGVVPRVEDGRVGLGSPFRHVVLPLQHRHLQLVLGQLIGGGRAGDAAADDDHVVHSKTSLSA